MTRTHTHPVPDVEEALLLGQVEHEQEAHRVSEERRGEAPESGQQRTGWTHVCDASSNLHTRRTNSEHGHVSKVLSVPLLSRRVPELKVDFEVPLRDPVSACSRVGLVTQTPTEH